MTILNITSSLYVPIAALVKFRGTVDVDKEMNEIRRENMESMNTEKVGILAVLRRDNPDWTRPLIICICLHLGQQFSGINAVRFNIYCRIYTGKSSVEILIEL